MQHKFHWIQAEKMLHFTPVVWMLAKKARKTKSNKMKDKTKQKDKYQNKQKEGRRQTGWLKKAVNTAHRSSSVCSDSLNKSTWRTRHLADMSSTDSFIGGRGETVVFTDKYNHAGHEWGFILLLDSKPVQLLAYMGTSNSFLHVSVVEPV